MKQKYLGTWNHFSYVSSRKVNFIDRILLKKVRPTLGICQQYQSVCLSGGTKLL
ncbi:hypothetical protein [Acinetobacter sp. G11]|uniref:hypothetical protein n=1 Tax=Acinetobacter sp. G11 TaxID=3415989 RepID=UPI003C7D3466